MIYYIYILYSPTADKYYIGSSNDPESRLEQHNTTDRNTYTHKYRPWELKVIFEAGKSRKEALYFERFIKKQKSRKFIERLLQPEFKAVGDLVQLVRVHKVLNGLSS